MTCDDRTAQRSYMDLIRIVQTKCASEQIRGHIVKFGRHVNTKKAK
jgi:hypothetical protein